jgi:hypothetical protein
MADQGGKIRSLYIALTVADKVSAAVSGIQATVDKFKSQTLGVVQPYIDKIEGIQKSYDNAVSGVRKYAASVQSGLSVATQYVQKHKEVLAVMGGELALLGAEGKAYYSEGVEDAAKYADAYDVLYQKMGANTDAYLEKMRDATDGTVSDLTIIQSTTKAMSMGLDPQAFAQLAEISRAAARNTGEDPSESYDKLITSIETMRTGTLAQIGISVRAQDAYARYATTIGKTAGQLTLAERRQAFLNAVLLEGQKITDKSNLSQESYTEQMSKFNNTLSDVRRALGESVLPVLAWVEEKLDVILQLFMRFPAPVKTAIGIFGLLTVGLTLVGGALLVQNWLVGALAKQHVSLFGAVTMTGTAYKDFLLALLGVVPAEGAAAGASVSLTGALYGLAGGVWAVLAPLLPFIAAVLAIGGAVWLLWDLFNMGWENSALHRGIASLQKSLDLLWKSPAFRVLAWLNPSTRSIATTATANDLWNASAAAQRVQNVTTSSAFSPAPVQQNNLSVDVNIPSLKTEAMSKEDLSKQIEKGVQKGLGSRDG